MVLVRPRERLLVLSVLSFDEQIVRPAAFQEQLPEVEVQAEELELARTLIEAAAAAEAFDFSRYRDVHTEQLQRLIEAKLAGSEPVAAPPASSPPPVGNLIDALRQSIAHLTPDVAAKKSANGRPRPQTARRRVGTSRRRKSS